MVGTGIWRETSKTWKIDTLNVERGIWQETVKNMKKKRIIHCKTLIMARKLTNKEKEKLKWQDLEYGKKHGKR